MEEFFKQFGCFLFSSIGFVFYWLETKGLQIMFIMGAIAFIIGGLLYGFYAKKAKS